MRCPICEAAKMMVVETRCTADEVYRRRKCSDPECSAVIYTVERECEHENLIRAYMRDLQKKAKRGGHND